MATEKKLVDTATVKKSLQAVHDWFNGPISTDQDKLAQAVVKMCIEEVDKINPVDAVPVVLCKDCKHRYGTPDCHHPLLLSYSWGAIRTVKDDDFCSYGERREET